MMPIELDRPVPIQTGFWGEVEPHPSFDEFPIGAPAVSVWGKIITLHPGIREFSYFAYDSGSTYKDDMSQDMTWRAWNPAVDLNALSEEIVRRSLYTLEFEGDTIRIIDILAIGSSVKMDTGEVMQIPMLDFEAEISPENHVRILEYGLPRGVLLESGGSYHYYGFGLMTQERWKKWIAAISTDAEGRELFGDTYLEICKVRGYSALRIFGYEGSEKPATPKVCARIPG
jgi:hypothetical protein